MRYFRNKYIYSLWRASVFYSFLVITWLYMQVMNVSFAVLDQGQNYHKVIIVCGYLIYLVFWWWFNQRIQELRR